MQVNWFFISSLSVTITTFFLIIILLKYGKEKIHNVWALFNLSVFGWGFFASLSAINTSVNLAPWLWKTANCPVSFISVFLLHITYFLNRQAQMLRKILIFAYIQAIIFSALLFSTDMVRNSFVKKYYNNTILMSGPGKLYMLWFILWSIIATYAHINLIILSIRKKPKDNTSLNLFLIASVLGFTCGSLNFLYFMDYPFFKFANFGIAIYCLLQTYAIFKHQLFGIEIAYKKGLFYSLFIAILTGIYFTIVFIVESLFRDIAGYRSIFESICFAFVISFIFNPLRKKLQALVDRLFLGKTHEEIAEENELLKQEIQSSDRLKTASTLALGLAHEIKNPITTIKTFAEYLPQKLDDKEFLLKFSKLIPVETERINNIVQQLLRFSKPSPPKFREVRMHRLIQETLTFLNSEFLKRKIELSETYENKEVTILADPEQIKQVLLNIIFNSMEAMLSGGTISIATKSNDNIVELSLRDTGCGITKEDLKHIFDPFFSKKESGTGLGLTVSHQIIKNHNGKIEVKSELNKGTTFMIKLPLIKIPTENAS